MSALAVSVRAGIAPREAAALIVAHFRAYNDEFGRITRRAAEHFLSGDAAALGQLDALAAELGLKS